MNSLTTSLPGLDPIHGVVFKTLKSFPDDRGFFREVIRSSDEFFDNNGFAQWSHSKMGSDVVKAWHFHHRQTDWWYIGIGHVQAALYDNREESPTYKTLQVFDMKGASNETAEDAYNICVKIPPGVLHGLRVLSSEAHIFYITSETYDPDDEGRIPFDSDEVPHNWGEGAITVANDRRLFIPAHPRELLAQ